MKNKLILSVILVLLFGSFLRADEVGVHANEYILVFTAQWCSPCKAMEKDVWPTQDVKAVSSQFYSGRPYRYESPKDDKQFEKWKVDAIPCVIVFNPKTQRLKRHVGYMDALRLKQFLLEAPMDRIINMTEYSGEYVKFEKKGN
jgi:thioredoxin-related protein